MTQQRILATVASLAFALGYLGFAVPVSRADDAPAASRVQKAKQDKPKHRLPPYYNKLVDGQQREKIYKIQDEYAPKIEELTAQLKALTEKRDNDVAAVLSDEQRTKLAALEAEAKAKQAEARKKNMPKSDAAASASSKAGDK